MELEEKQGEDFFYFLKIIKTKFMEIFFHKKIKKISLALFLLCVFVSGTFSGLIISGYFGTFDEPSERARSLLNAMNVGNLYVLRSLAQGIVRENVKIPMNYIVAEFSDIEKLNINIGFDNLKKIEYGRQNAIEKGFLVSSNDSYVPAKITHGGEEYDIKMRLKGDLPDHWSGDKWSFRIKVKDDKKILGMEIFSIQSPETRWDINEWLYHKFLKQEGLIGLRYEFVEIVINGENKGVYAMEEHFSKELIESNKRREGVILKFDESLAWQNGMANKSVGSEFIKASIESFENENNILEDPVKLNQFNMAKGLLDLFRKRELNASDVFDIEKVAKYYAIGTFMNCHHGESWGNSRFYYNPINSRMELIGFDGNCRLSGANIALEKYAPACIYESSADGCGFEEGSLNSMILGDKKIFTAYMVELERLSGPDYLGNSLKVLDGDLNLAINRLRKDKPFFYFSETIMYASQRQLGEAFSPIKVTNSNLESFSPDGISMTLSLANIYHFPIKIVKASANGVEFYPDSDYVFQKWNISTSPEYVQIFFRSREGFNISSRLDSVNIYYKFLGVDEVYFDEVSIIPRAKDSFSDVDFVRQKTDFNNLSFLSVNLEQKEIYFKQGDWEISNDLIIPENYTLSIFEGTSIDLVENSMILSNGAVNIGGDNSLVSIYSSDGTGQGISVIDAEGNSIIKNVLFEGLKSPSKQSWELSGAINFYNSNVDFDNASFIKMNSEDSLNVINSYFRISKSFFGHCFSDCLDVDFGNGFIEDSFFEECGNDCLDFSGSNCEIINVSIKNVGDKSISAGENSTINAENIKIFGENVYIGFASKDLSVLNISSSSIDNAEYGVVAYEKKMEYGGSKVFVSDVNIFETENDYFIEEGSDLTINGYIYLNKEINVYDLLYNGE